jgi:chromosome segregation ATPase
MREVSNAEWDDIKDRLKEKDTEIEILHNTLGKLDAYVPELEAEIDRLQARALEFIKIIIADRKLLTRAADALKDVGAWRGGLNTAHSKLLDDLRDAAK